ncbi:hypothetical protein M501DRAFT_1005791 [Patellaria atrata CBS 101060]|uniref:Betaine lipid synthase n=1 Tax=Patellaria atrata CBS 101060 TaxID=1346257 RepID=A0A9P4SHP1_9PEZI|nr:hypothetical protein M501DRAFT_1005791 [Patellaria atrata CBS 101060]
MADPRAWVAASLFSVIVFVFIIFFVASLQKDNFSDTAHTIKAYLKFVYSCFLKPHTGDENGGQQAALESFYKAQATVYDATRTRLLHGREDMLGLVAAQMKFKEQTRRTGRKPIWIDIGGGTGYNIEQMAKFLPVSEFFQTVYLVDLSPSLCDIARSRFARLGWENVRVLCEDARSFNLSEQQEKEHGQNTAVSKGESHNNVESQTDGAALITMSYALSMIPDIYPLIDTLSTLLSPEGIIGVCDFYVQNQVDYQSRNYTGGVVDRHCTWISRVFWRTWFEVDRVNLEPARRDYLEYRFGTILNINARNHFLGVRIPYYIWVGCSKENGSTTAKLAELDAAATESPFLEALDLHASLSRRANSIPSDVRSKALECAIVNLSASLPLPSAWYQNHNWRIYYDYQLQKHRQFKDEYIYAFTWEDSRVDARLLKVRSDDVILALTSAGDNILSFALEKPRRIHAVDLNPTQNHLLELKVAAFTALGYSDVWKLFGEGKNDAFQELLVTKLSPHMSSLAFQYWLQNGHTAFKDRGLYYTGGSRHAIQLVGWLFKIFGLSGQVQKLCSASTLNEQREIWHRSLRNVLLSRILSWTIISNERWLWKALGVPPNQRNLIEKEYVKQEEYGDAQSSRSGHAIWEYMVNTLDPVVNNTLLSEDNHYYLLCLQGHYSRRCHPDYLTPKAHIKLSAPNAFDSLRIHTDEINEVIARISPATLTIAVVMDSMDWFDPKGADARNQIRALNRALKMGGRVLLRSAGLTPWYIARFEEMGFVAKRVAARMPGSCVDRVNMYASTWLCTKIATLEKVHAKGLKKALGSMEKLKI